jgi:hypothetical protein
MANTFLTAAFGETGIKLPELGPLSEEEIRFMREFGDVVYNQKKYFM